MDDDDDDDVYSDSCCDADFINENKIDFMRSNDETTTTK